jgi:hypothetical protein
VVIDPFAPASGAAPLWTAQAMRTLAYKAGAVLNAGFAADSLTMQAVEDGGVPAPTAASPWLVAYVRAIELEGGDELHLVLKAPDGAVLAESSRKLDRDRAQELIFVGKRRPPAGWPPGTYRAGYAVLRQGKPVITRGFTIGF